MTRKHPIAILTGASRGIGFAVAEKMAEEGYHIVLSSRHPEEAADLLRSRYDATVLAVPTDLADVQAADKLVEAAQELGGLDALFLNHGGPPVKTIEEVTEEEWQYYFQLMVTGPLRVLKKALPLFRAQGGGRVVAITSFTVKNPYRGFVLSNSLRAALNNALKTAALDYGPENILINTVAPGFILTRRIEEWNEAQAAREGTTPEAIARHITRQIPLKRYGEPAEIAEVIAFLLSPRNGYITGQQLLVDGGLVVAN